ncbi:hypothetical protein V500_01365 [Pseudogymnoascus sp. VKM F-4518 (FW-2643)]|nr:hypothetical protein V500_01365 [Pseudogymnoascus sp. VKM F-4518 (FW-2643)]
MFPPSKRSNPPALDNVPSPFRAQIALDLSKKERENKTIKEPEISPFGTASSRTSPPPSNPPTSIPDSESSSTPPKPRQNTHINNTLAGPGSSSQPDTSLPRPKTSVISTPSAADPKGKLPTLPVSEIPSLPAAPPSGNSNEARIEWKTWREQTHSETEIHPPEVQQPATPQPAPRRGRGTGRGRPGPRPRASRARSAATSKPEPDPIPVPYRAIRDAQDKPIFREAEHDREGLAGMIGVTKEEWGLGLRTPVYAPPSDWMRLRGLQRESENARKYPWVKEIEGYLARREEEVELARRVHVNIMDVGWAVFNERWRIEEVMGVPIPDEPGLRKKVVEEMTYESAETVSQYSGEASQVEPDRMDPHLMEEGVEGPAGESGDGTAATPTQPRLGREDAMDVDEVDGLTGTVGAVQSTPTTKVGAAVGRSDGSAESPICVDSSSAGEDEFDET